MINTMEPLTVIKISGNNIDNPAALAQFLKDFSGVEGKKILVHGGGKLASELSEALGIPARLVDGRRITCRETLKVVTMVYAGLVNKNIVSQLQANGCNALGLTGADGNIITARKRKAGMIDYGFAGDIEAINTNLIFTLLNSGITPVIAPLTHDKHGTLLNTNADTIAAELTAALTAFFQITLVYCFEKGGVLASPENDNSVIARMSQRVYRNLKSAGTISGGMIPKLDTAFKALRAGAASVCICHASQVLSALQGVPGSGTRIHW